LTESHAVREIPGYRHTTEKKLSLYIDVERGLYCDSDNYLGVGASWGKVDVSEDQFHYSRVRNGWEREWSVSRSNGQYSGYIYSESGQYHTTEYVDGNCEKTTSRKF
jgi:hypothetical protein